MEKCVNTQTSKIALLGAGAWGTALALLISRNGFTVHLWDHDPQRLSQLETERQFLGVPFPDQLIIQNDLATAVRDCRDIGLVIPSHAFKTVLTQLKSLTRSDVRFFWGTKGVDPSGEFLHELIFHIFSNTTPVALISGPSFAKEVALNLPTAVNAAGNNPDFLKDIILILTNPNFSVSIHADMIGLQVCGAVKNVMAIAVGIVDGMKWGTNGKCALITKSLKEMSALCVAKGGLADTVMSLAGVGDLVLTCTDNQSRNRRFGLKLGEGLAATVALKEIGESVEGYYNTKQLFELAKKADVLMPIAKAVYEIIYGGQSAKERMQELI